MEWEAVGIVLSAAPFGEGDAVVTLLTAEHGAHNGLVRGARARGSNRSVWEIGNVVRARWVGRLAEQLGSLTGEALQSPSSHLFDRKIPMAALASACAVAAGALRERSTVVQTYDAMVGLLAGLARGTASIPHLVRWEAVLLSELGYGLDLTRCAVTGATSDLVLVSPRTGRAVSRDAAGLWRDRLLKLPAFLRGQDEINETSPVEWRDGLALTGYFLARDAFGSHHQPMPQARVRLVDLVDRQAKDLEGE
jgi:DNA repair protein RecO (recombination protein O)